MKEEFDPLKYVENFILLLLLFTMICGIAFLFIIHGQG